MNEQMIYLLGGVALATVFALILRLPAVRDAGRRHAMALFVAALIYVGFAVAGGSVGGMAREGVGVIAFGAVALVGLRRRSALLLALGWALHPIWDIALHSSGAGFDYTPHGYVPLCIGFDLALAALIVMGWAGRLAPAATAPGDPTRRGRRGRAARLRGAKLLTRRRAPLNSESHVHSSEARAVAQYLKEEVQQRIDRAALETFAQEGFARATVAAIARRAAISTGNVYRYYPGKEALFEALLPPSFAEQLRELLRAAARRWRGWRTIAPCRTARSTASSREPRSTSRSRTASGW